MLLFIREQMNSNVIRRKATGVKIYSKQQRLATVEALRLRDTDRELRRLQDS